MPSVRAVSRPSRCRSAPATRRRAITRVNPPGRVAKKGSWKAAPFARQSPLLYIRQPACCLLGARNTDLVLSQCLQLATVSPREEKAPSLTNAVRVLQNLQHCPTDCCTYIRPSLGDSTVPFQSSPSRTDSVRSPCSTQSSRTDDHC